MKNTMESLECLFKQQITHLHSGEKQILELLPKMEKAVNNEYLKRAISDHRIETQSHLKRLEKIGNLCNIEFGEEKCSAAAGLVKECEKMININATGEVKDAGIIAQAQKIEHFEISGYGTSKHYANRLGFTEAEKLLAETLSEEQQCDTNLNRIARRDINQKALS